jgi:poly(hydroxyalkanoate) depolymerase family esterase
VITSLNGGKKLRTRAEIPADSSGAGAFMRVNLVALILLMGAASGLNALTKTTTTISSSLNPSIYGQAVTFKAVVSPQPPNGETVTFKEGSTILGTGTLSSGTASLTTTVLKESSAGDNMKATYSGDSTFSTSTSTGLAQVVNQATTKTTLSSSQNPANVGQSVILTATVAPQFSGTVTGTVTFYNGSTRVGSGTLANGVATCTSTNLPAGSDSITAVYKGSGTFITSTSKALDETVGTGETIDTTMSWDGVTRYYQLFVPTVLPANPPMLLMLHGTTFDTPPDNPSTQDWGWQSYADEYGFVLVQPASTYNPNTGQWNWNDYFMDAAFAAGEGGTCTSPPATACPDDAGFLRQLIVNLTSKYHVNPQEVFVTGFSSGAQMTERVGVEISDLVAAIAPTSGEMEGQQAAPPPVLAPGNEAAPVSVQEWQGTEDTELPPCNYGTTVYSGVTYYLDTVDDTFNYWVKQNQCTALQTSQTLCTDGEATPGLSGNIASSCVDSNIEVQFIWEEGLGHSWAAKNNSTRWQFLSAHPKSSGDVKNKYNQVHVLSK